MHDAVDALTLWEATPFEAITNGFDSAHNPIVTYRINERDVTHDVVDLYRQHMKYLGPCASAVHVLLTCGHERRSTCAAVFSGSGDLCCTQQVPRVCDVCNETSEYPCSLLRDSTAVIRCNRIQPKRCQCCKQHALDVPCHEIVLECGKEATTTLICGHTRRWTCAVTTAVGAADVCLTCVAAAWKQAWMDQSVDELDRDTKEALHLSVADFVQRQIPKQTSFLIEDLSRVQFEPTDLKSHMNCCQTIVKALWGLIEGKKLEPEQLPPSVPARLEVDKHYDIVFLPCKADNKQRTVKLTQTPYGMGTLLCLLGDESISETMLKLSQKHDAGNNLVVHVVVGIAFRLRPLQRTNQFCKQKELRASKSKAKNANKLSRQSVKKGFDCVDKFSEENQHHLDEYSVHARTYWYPHAFLPLLEGNIRLQYECAICFETKAKRNGILCKDAHFMCEDCFVQYVRSTGEQGAIERSGDDEGNIACPNESCSAKYTLQYVAKQTSEGSVAYKTMMELGFRKHLDKELPAALDAKEAEIKARYEQILRMEGSKREAHLIHHDIVENILTLQCPRCKAAFVDFDGCFALTCSRNLCRCGFCAWCLGDCGADAHAHVARCPERDPHLNGVFGTQAQFLEHHRVRKARALQQQMESVHDEAVKRILRELLLPDAVDLRITREEWWLALPRGDNGDPA